MIGHDRQSAVRVRIHRAAFRQRGSRVQGCIEVGRRSLVVGAMLEQWFDEKIAVATRLDVNDLSGLWNTTSRRTVGTPGKLLIVLEDLAWPVAPRNHVPEPTISYLIVDDPCCQKVTDQKKYIYPTNPLRYLPKPAP